MYLFEYNPSSIHIHTHVKWDSPPFNLQKVEDAADCTETHHRMCARLRVSHQKRLGPNHATMHVVQLLPRTHKTLVPCRLRTLFMQQGKKVGLSSSQLNFWTQRNTIMVSYSAPHIVGLLMALCSYQSVVEGKLTLVVGPTASSCGPTDGGKH